MSAIYDPEEDVNEAPQEMTYEEFEEYKQSCEAMLEMAKAASRLAENPDFKKIVMEEYFQKEPARLGGLMASGHLTPSAFDDAAYDLRSIGHLRTFLQDFIQKGNIAQDELKNLEIAREEAILAQEEA